MTQIAANGLPVSVPHYTETGPGNPRQRLLIQAISLTNTDTKDENSTYTTDDSFAFWCLMIRHSIRPAGISLSRYAKYMGLVLALAACWQPWVERNQPARPMLNSV